VKQRGGVGKRYGTERKRMAGGWWAGKTGGERSQEATTTYGSWNPKPFA